MVKEKVLSALIAVVCTVGIAIALTAVSTGFYESYSMGVFVATPIVCGVVSVLAYNRRGKKLLGESLFVSFLSGCFSLIGFILVGLEGLICLVMVLPLALPLFVFGGFLGFLLSRAIRRRMNSDIASFVLVALVPFFMGFENRIDEQATVREVASKIVIEGNIENVRSEVVGFTPIPEPENLLFKIGIAYPKSARIEGTGVGAIRYCNFSTGTFVEPITHWEENKRLAFVVAEQPLPMTEVSPYVGIHPPHLDWAVISERGEFLLNDLGDGKIELVGTTWFHTVMEPEPYWGWLSDRMIHAIHARVLNHIKTTVEQGSESDES